MNQQPLTRQRGLTLIELLIAMSLTVLISALAYRFLDTAASVEAQADDALAEWMALEAFFVWIAADLEQAVDRPVAKPAVGIDPLAALIGTAHAGLRPALLSSVVAGQPLATLTDREGSLLWLTRQGWVNPLHEDRSELQRVLYRLDNNQQLFRDVWPERNQPLSAVPLASRRVLDAVQSVELAYLPPETDPVSGIWLREWPLPVSAPDSAASHTTPDTTQDIPPVRLPAALRVVVQTERLGRIERIFCVRVCHP